VDEVQVQVLKLGVWCEGRGGEEARMMCMLSQNQRQAKQYIPAVGGCQFYLLFSTPHTCRGVDSSCPKLRED
jgi:hypothetical protein